MTKQEFYESFTLEEWELLCSKIEFLNAFVAEPFNVELAEAIAYRILDSNPPPFRKPLETEDGLEE
jgi:hypothetical protein